MRAFLYIHNMSKKLYLFFILVLFSTNQGIAQTVGTIFQVGSITYQITRKDLLNPANNTAGIYQILGAGSVYIPSSVINTT